MCIKKFSVGDISKTEIKGCVNWPKRIIKCEKNMRDLDAKITYNRQTQRTFNVNAQQSITRLYAFTWIIFIFAIMGFTYNAF